MIGKPKTLAIVMSVLFIMAGCGGETEPEPSLQQSKESPEQRSSPDVEPSFAAAEQQFALDLFHEMMKKAGGSQNMFISPYSVQQALLMTANGAAGDSRKEILHALSIEQMDITSINQSSRSLIQSYKTLPHGEFSAANSIWSKPELKKGFTDKIAGLGDAYQLNKDPQLAADEVNAWTAKKTGGHIDQIIDRVPPDTIAYIINAVFFKEYWKQPFDEKLTAPHPFYAADGSKKDHPMMTQTNRFSYQETKRFQAVKLPYKDDGLALAVFLPKKTENLQSLLKEWTYENWRESQARWEMKQVELKLPRFSIDAEYVLNDPLKQLGLKTVFHQADFSNMFAGDLAGYIKEVKHHTFIKVDEAGTEAAAATKVEIVESGAVPDVTMTVDHPFYFAVFDEKTGMILFLGSVAKPVEG
ncbi:serpin family protein [Bacillus sonorensis]|uniref:serpin family protein n=1 Tax=Bacillus sonorensis TaxID=119858 RepID=UPI000496B411|nr:serpin family protein [Bacillus sonorensis]MEC1502504.1 serpin family protein [Bacillus sonorensis]MEC1591152.1 serpin family protein [Bacillus sonorensis]